MTDLTEAIKCALNEMEESQLARAHALELDPTLVDEAWLRENGFRGQTGTYLVLPGRHMDCSWSTHLGWVLNWHNVEFRNPTRGLVRTLQRIGGGT